MPNHQQKRNVMIQLNKIPLGPPDQILARAIDVEEKDALLQNVHTLQSSMGYKSTTPAALRQPNLMSSLMVR